MPDETTAKQDYVKQIFLLQQETGRATTQELAARLGVKPPSVTAMIKRLAEEESGEPLVRHTPYRGVELTERGLAVALEMLRHHRLIELFLTELLGVPWDEVHEEAERLEHVLSERLEARISAKLGDPRRDPHGHPIPTAELVLETGGEVPLSDLAPGRCGTVVHVPDGEPALLQYLAEMGIVPGAAVELEAVAPFGGVLTVRVGERREALGSEVAAQIWVSEEAR